MRRPHVVPGGLGIKVVRVFKGAVGKDHAPDAINEGGIVQMICTLKKRECHISTGNGYNNTLYAGFFKLNFFISRLESVLFLNLFEI